MSTVNLFILIPELKPQFNWINSNNNLLLSGDIYRYLDKLNSLKEEIKLENYNGYFDKSVFKDLLDGLDTLNDYYPKPPQTRLKRLFNDFFDWRENPIHSNENEYKIFAQPILAHTLCEISQRIHNITGEKFAILNHEAIRINNTIDVIINDTHSKSLEILENENELILWFSNNRIPRRNFQAIPKHNIPEAITISNKIISPLRCTEAHANEIIKIAFGNNLKELFSYDSLTEMVIVFKYENITPQNQYHGYHVNIDSPEIPPEILIKIRQYFKI